MYVNCLLLCSLIFPFSYSLKTINISIMVPGITAFDNLVEEVKNFPSLFQKHQVLSSNVSEDKIVKSSLNANYSFNVSAFFVEHLQYYKSKRKNMQIDLKSLLRDHHVTYPWSYALIRPALEIALRQVEGTRNLLDGYQINLCYYDSGNKFGKASDR